MCTWVRLVRRAARATRGAARMRSKGNFLGDLNLVRDKTANTLLRNSVRIIRYIERLGRFWSLENPLSSLIWLFPGLHELRLSRFFVKLDQCVYRAGIPGEGLCKKATAILMNLGSLWAFAPNATVKKTTCSSRVVSSIMEGGLPARSSQAGAPTA